MAVNSLLAKVTLAKNANWTHLREACNSKQKKLISSFSHAPPVVEFVFGFSGKNRAHKHRKIPLDTAWCIWDTRQDKQGSASRCPWISCPRNGRLSRGFSEIVCRSLKNYQYSTEGQKLHENLAPVLVIISGKSLVYWFLPVLRPRRVSTSSGNKSVSQYVFFSYVPFLVLRYNMSFQEDGKHIREFWHDTSPFGLQLPCADVLPLSR